MGILMDNKERFFEIVEKCHPKKVKALKAAMKKQEKYDETRPIYQAPEDGASAEAHQAAHTAFSEAMSTWSKEYPQLSEELQAVHDECLEIFAREVLDKYPVSLTFKLGKFKWNPHAPLIKHGEIQNRSSITVEQVFDRTAGGQLIKVTNGLSEILATFDFYNENDDAEIRNNKAVAFQTLCALTKYKELIEPVLHQWERTYGAQYTKPHTAVSK